MKRLIGIGFKFAGTCALGLGLVLTAAWIKSRSSDVLVCYPAGDGVDEISMAGKIGFSWSNHTLVNDRFVRGTTCEIDGLFCESLTLLAPRQSSAPEPVAPRAGVDIAFDNPPETTFNQVPKEMVPESREEIALEVDSEEFAMEGKGIQLTGLENPEHYSEDLAEPALLPVILGESEVSGSELSSTSRQVTSTLRWNLGDFYANKSTTPRGHTSAFVVIPYWSVVSPLFLMAALAFYWPRTRQPSAKMAQAVVANQSPRRR